MPIVVARGVESISCVQNEMNRHMVMDSWLKAHKPEVYWPMLQTAEAVAKIEPAIACGISPPAMRASSPMAVPPA